jgi:hypothetical protein
MLTETYGIVARKAARKDLVDNLPSCIIIVAMSSRMKLGRTLRQEQISETEAVEIESVCKACME